MSRLADVIYDILLNNKLNPETKVYEIANKIHNEDPNKINPVLWYAILELKDKHLKDIQTLPNVNYFDHDNEEE